MNKRHILSGLAIAAFTAIAAPLAHADDSCEIGATLTDGTVCAGISPDTSKPIYTLPADADVAMDWKNAMEYAANLNAHGHDDWKLPSMTELHVLYQNRHKGALRDTFDQNGSLIAGWYWSSTERPDNAGHAWMERFSDGYRTWGWKGLDASVRPVRSELHP